MNIDLAAALGGAAGDGTADRVVVNATKGNDTINVSGDAAGVNVTRSRRDGRGASRGSANDRLEINTVAGTDSITTAGLAAGLIQLFVDGVLVP